MEAPEVKFGEWIQQGFVLYKNNFGLLVLATLVAVLLSSATLGILLGPMTAGMVLISLALCDQKEPKPQIGDIFKGFSYFLNTFLFFLVWGILIVVVSVILGFIPILGQLVSVCIYFLLTTGLMFAVFLIVERQMSFWPASLESFNLVKANFWPFLALGVIAGLIGGLGTIACGIGVIFTSPIQLCILTVAYRAVYGQPGSKTEQSSFVKPPTIG